MTWLSQRDQNWHKCAEVVATGVASPGFKPAAGEELPAAREVRAPFHVVAVAVGNVDACRCRN